MSENKLDVKNYALYMVQRFLTKVVFQYVMHAMQILMVKSIFPNHLRMSSFTNIAFSFCSSYPAISSPLHLHLALSNLFNISMSKKKTKFLVVLFRDTENTSLYLFTPSYFAIFSSWVKSRGSSLQEGFHTYIHLD